MSYRTELHGLDPEPDDGLKELIESIDFTGTEPTGHRCWQERYVICQHPGCPREGVPCFLPDHGPDDPDDPDEWFCVDHAPEHGYCYVCGTFSAGMEAFDFPNIYGHYPGMCPGCSDETKAEMEMIDFEEDDYV